MAKKGIEKDFNLSLLGKQLLYGLAVEVAPRRPNDMRRRSAVENGRHTVLTAIQHHHTHGTPSLMASTATRNGGFNEHELIYITKSPDFCRPDKQSGSLGTVGRICNATNQGSSGSCASLCCGRGYETAMQEQVERCNCKYIWCCTVKTKLFLLISNGFMLKFIFSLQFFYNSVQSAGPLSDMPTSSGSPYLQIVEPRKFKKISIRKVAFHNVVVTSYKPFSFCHQPIEVFSHVVT